MTEEGDQTLKRAILSVTVLAVISVIVLFVLRTSGTADKQTPAQIHEITGDGTEFFALHGWETEKVSEKNIKIPREFSKAYAEYALIQEKQGLPLKDFSGRDAVLFTYSVKNYSPSGKEMSAELIVCDGIAVSALVYSTDGSVKLEVI